MPSLASLVCPKCHGPLIDEAGRELRCMRDGIRYPLIDGIPSFIIPGAEPAALPGCALSLVIPALNEAESLDQVLPELKKALAALGPTSEIIVVDGGSRDGTQEIVRKHEVRFVSQTLPGFEQTFRKLRDNLADFDVSKVRYDEIQRSAIMMAPAAAE